MAIEKRRPLPALTGIRIFAAMYVVLLHTGSGYLGRHGAPRAMVEFLSKGYFAVSLFFVLSGFILAYTYEGAMNGGRQARDFWVARFARVYPVYLLALALAFPFSWDVTPRQRFAVLAMIQSWMPWSPYLARAWNFPAWSLSVEAFFYLCFPILLPALNRLTVARLRALAVALLALIAAGNLAQPIENWPRASWVVARYVPLPLLRLPEFAVGMALGLLFLRAPKWKNSGIVSVAMAALAVAWLCLPVGRWGSAVVAPFAALIVSLAYPGGPLARLLSTRVLILLGGASYAVYLLQLPVRIYVRLLVARAPRAPHDLDAFLSPAILLLASILVFLYWEEPSRKFLRKLLGLRSRWRWPHVLPAQRLEEPLVIKSADDQLL